MSCRLVAPTVLVPLALTFACAPADAPDDEARPPRAPVSVEPEPTLSVGVVEGDPMQEFDGVRSPFLTPDGRLVVPLAGPAELRVFGPDGAFVQSLGRQGSGPGEFTGLRTAWPRADTIEVWDSQARRITRFVPEAGPEVVGVSSGVPFDGGLGPLGDGWALIAVDFPESGVRDRMSAHGIAREGGHLGVIAETEGMARFRTPAIIGPHPLTPTAIFRVADGEVYVAETLDPTVRVYDREGVLRREVALPLEPLDDPVGVFAAVIDTAVARAGGDLELGERLALFPDPEAIPLFQDFLIDAEGFLWVRPYDPFRHALPLGGRPGGYGGPGGSWLIFTPAGLPAGEVAIPQGLEPVEVTSDAMLGIHRDPLGVESVRVHTLVRS